MTLPSLIASHQKKVLESQLKKTRAVIEQVLIKTRADLGVENLYDYAVYDPSLGYLGYYKANEFTDEFYKNLNVVKVYTQAKLPDAMNYNGTSQLNYNSAIQGYITKKPDHQTKDGALYQIVVAGSLDANMIHISVDINGFKKPNKYGHDLFTFVVDKTGRLDGKKMMKLYTQEELDAMTNLQGIRGLPCSIKSKQASNGIGCAWYAIRNICPDDPAKKYWECLP